MIRRSSSDSLVGATLGKYRLEEVVEQSKLGPLFTARSSDAPQARYLVRVLAVQPFASQEALGTYWKRFQQQASSIATLQHPYILPLVDYGIADVTPYAVWPHVPVRSLSARLAQSGPVDPLTVGRYLDQIAAALEYAHERATLHCNLGTDCLLLQPDGHVVVADLGVRRMIELSGEGQWSYAFFGSVEACAPEQLLGGHVDTYTDVYALGAVVYRLLIGHPVFGGNTFEDIAQQHLSASIPPLSLWQAGLPAGLDALIATAMAKEPAARFPHPGALANAYHDIVAPNRMTRVPFISQDGPAADHPPQTPAGSRAATARQGSLGQGTAGAPPTGRTAPPPYAASGAQRLGLAKTRSLTRLGRTMLFAALLLVVVSGTAYTLAALNGGLPGGLRPTGVVLFVDSQNGPPGHTDAAQVIIHNLGAPASGYFYNVWLLNTTNEQTTALGTLSGQGGTFRLNDMGDGRNGAPGSNLLSLGNKIEVTLEQGHVRLPVGSVRLTGTFPPQAFAHIQHLLVSFPTTPGQIGLLVGLLQQTQLLTAQAQLLQSVATGRNTVGISCAAQNIVDLIEGTKGPNYHALPATCASQNIAQVGDGFGIAAAKGYLATAAEHASNAAIAPDSTSYIRTHAGHVEVATTNIGGWVATLDHEALALLADPSSTSQVSDMVTLAVHAYQGVDINGDEQVDPVPGEAGAITAYDHGQLMAAVTLSPVG
jgi:hypothetical protein